jgi:hypothetical protein
LQPAKAIIIYGQRAIFATESRTNRHETALEGNRAITWVVILVVINTIAIAVGLLFIVPTWAASQESEHPQENANDFARSVLRNEVKAACGTGLRCLRGKLSSIGRDSGLRREVAMKL